MKNKSILFVSILMILYSCSDMKKTQYGNLIFETEYDGLMHTDKLWLYDNGVFKINMPDIEANGTFRLKEDTIFLNYYKFKGIHSQAFKIENEGVYELAEKNGVWIKSSRDTYMGIYINEIPTYNKK